MALRGQGVALGVARPTTSVTLMPLPAATPGSGVCSSTDARRALVVGDRRRAFSFFSRARAAVRLDPTRFGSSP